MNPETFFENFDILCEAPNSIQKLRELILQLAVQGKLVPHDPNDEPASVLIEKIKAEKKRISKKSKTKESKSINGINSSQFLYEIPPNWEWTILSECGLINPRNDVPDEKEVSFVPMTYISEKYGQNVETENRIWKEVKKGFTHFAENDVVLAKITPCFQNGKSAVMTGLNNGFGAGTTELHVFRPLNELINSKYVLIYLKSPDFIYNGISKMTGSAGQKRVPKDYFSENPFPLPPLAEQKRIVEKVNELMALCDKLEARRQKKQELQSKLNSAALDRMLSAENQEEFEENWQNICENFDLLYDNPENVEKLKQAVLQLAVQGKLVPQNPEDEPANVLLEKIKIEKKKIAKKSKTQGSKSRTNTNSEQVPYEIPSNWKWTALSECGLINPRNYLPDEKEVSFVPMTFISEKYGQNVETETRRWREIKKGFTHFAENDVVLAKITPCFQNGKSTVMRGLQNGFGAGTTELHVFRPLIEYISPDYVLIYLKSPSFIDDGIPKMTGSAGQKRVPKDYFSESPFPLPPLDEQKRIVEKVEQFMDLCDELDSKLRKTREESEKLMESVVWGLLKEPTAEI